MKNTLLIAFVLITCQASSQDPSFTALGTNFADEAYAIKATSTGDYLIAGGYERDGFDTAEVLLLKINAEGDTIWAKTYGSDIDTTHFVPSPNSRHLSGGNIGYDIHEREDGSFVIAGVAHFFGEGMGDGYLLNIGADGDLIWSKSYGGSQADILFSMLPQDDGGYILGGLTESFGIEARGGFCLRVDQFGDTLWTQVVSNGFIDEYHSLAATSGTDFIAAGTTFAGIDDSSDIRVSRFTQDGEHVWEKTYGGSLNEFCTKIINDPLGGFLIVGSTASFGSGDRDAFCMKIDDDGEIVWSMAYGGPQIDDANHIELLEDGNFLITGNTASYGAGNDDLMLLKIDPNGQVIWTSTYGGEFYDYGRCVVEEPDGDLILVGYGTSFDQFTNDFFVDNDIFLIKTDSGGNTACNSASIDILAVEAATEQNTYEPAFVSGTEVHDPPTIVGYTFSGLWNACEPPVMSVENLDTQAEMKLFPNPCIEVFQIEIEGAQCGETQFSLVNLQGANVPLRVRCTGKQKFEADVSKLAAGMYLLRAKWESGLVSAPVVVE